MYHIPQWETGNPEPFSLAISRYVASKSASRETDSRIKSSCTLVQRANIFHLGQQKLTIQIQLKRDTLGFFSLNFLKDFEDI